MFKYHVAWIKLDFYLLMHKITRDSLLISITSSSNVTVMKECKEGRLVMYARPSGSQPRGDDPRKVGSGTLGPRKLHYSSYN